MKPHYFSMLFAFLLLASSSAANAAGSLLRITCTGEDVGAEVTINGKFKGECPVDMEIKEGTYKLRVAKSDASYDYVFEQDIRMGDGVVKKVEVALTKRLNAAGQKSENDRLAAEREAAARREAQLQENARRQREALLAEQAAYLAKGPEMIAIPGKSYEMGKFEVTQAEWRAVMGSNPSMLHCEPSTITNCKSDKNPVEQVSWDDIQIFLQKLNSTTGKQYRLPTEAEWEYACHGGQGSQGGVFSGPTYPEYCGGDNLDAVGWYEGNSGQTTHPVGQKQANGYGLYDMTGNVKEWMSDCWEGGCGERVLRGGSWQDGPPWDGARASYRIGRETAWRLGTFGFRLARTLP